MKYIISVVGFLIFLASVSCDNPGQGGGSYKTFIVAENYSGDLITAEGNTLANGIAAADSLCMADANYPGTGTYKAFIVDGTNRVACTTAHCSGGASEHVNWVLKKNSEYYRSNGTTLIMQTDENGIFVFGNLGNSFVGIGTNRYWTGLGETWLAEGYDCSGWETDSESASADAGSGDVTDINAITGARNACSASSYAGLLCVEQ